MGKCSRCGGKTIVEKYPHFRKKGQPWVQDRCTKCGRGFGLRKWKNESGNGRRHKKIG